VIMVDHVNKDTGSRGRWATGGQHKLAALDGAAYVIETQKPFGRGLAGVADVRVAKDRPGAVRPTAGQFRKSDRTQPVATFHFEGKPDGAVAWHLESPGPATAESTGTNSGCGFRPTHYMERVSDSLDGQDWRSTTDIRESVGGKRQAVVQALGVLLADGYVETKSGGRRAKLYKLIKPYQQADDPLADDYTGDSEAGQ
jgi:hypothetical protein